MLASFDRSCNCLVFSLHFRVVTFYFKLNTEQSFENENTYDVFMNEVSMEDEPLQKREKNCKCPNRGK